MTTFEKTSNFKKIRRAFFAFASATVVLTGLAACTDRAASAGSIMVPPPVRDEAPGMRNKETIVLAGGCFWGVQGVFQHVRGVTSAVSGYAGGAKNTANYTDVSDGDTGHAESVRVTFDPQQVSYGHLLQIYFSVAHDPTQLNHQDADIGTQYRSAIFPTNSEQADVARAYIAQLNQAKIYNRPVVTTIEQNKTFHRAEKYHQNYLNDNPTDPYIAYKDMPKLENLQKLFPKDYRIEPVLVSKADIEH